MFVSHCPARRTITLLAAIMTTGALLIPEYRCKPPGQKKKKFGEFFKMYFWHLGGGYCPVCPPGCAYGFYVASACNGKRAQA